MKKLIKISEVLLGIAIIFALALSSCDKNNKEDEDDGKIDPGSIATANLVAYFPFDGNGTEKVASLQPEVTTNVTYVTGRRGQAYQGANEARLLYTLPANSKMKDLKSFSVAMWIRSPLVTGDPEQTVFEIGKSTDLFWGNLKLGLLRTDDTSDSLKLKIFFLKDGVDWSGQHIDFSSKVFAINRWMHLVYTYDAASSKFMIYKDGAKVTTNEGVENRWAASDEVSPRPPLGEMLFKDADKINIGAWRPKSEGTADDAWMGWFQGNIDELRVYDKGLTATEVKDLYDAEITQLND